MERNAAFFGKLFLSTFCLSAFTVGGGFVIVPLMKKKFVDELGWIDENEMLDITAIAQSSPGAIAVNASILIGFRLPTLISGAIVIENIFQWPGVGVWFTDAIKTQNTPIIMSVGLFMVLMVLISSLLVDILTAVLDPRVKLS